MPCSVLDTMCPSREGHGIKSHHQPGFIVVHECFSEHGIFSMESVTAMLTDAKLRNLKPQEKLYKVNDRDVAVTAAGSISFRYNYSINGR